MEQDLLSLNMAEDAFVYKNEYVKGLSWNNLRVTDRSSYFSSSPSTVCVLYNGGSHQRKGCRECRKAQGVQGPGKPGEHGNVRESENGSKSQRKVNFQKIIKVREFWENIEPQIKCQTFL